MLHEQRTWIVLPLCAIRHCHLQGTLPCQCLHFKMWSGYFFLVLSWICVFSFLSSSSEVNLLLPTPFSLFLLKLLLNTQLTENSVNDKLEELWKEKKKVFINKYKYGFTFANQSISTGSFTSPMYSQLPTSSYLCPLSVHSQLMFLAFIFIPYLNKKHLLLQTD